MTGIDALLRDAEHDRVRRADVPTWTAPMLATLTEKRFSGAGWIFERKYDGERVLAFRDGESTRLYSRNRKKLNLAYPEIVDCLDAQERRRFVVDGEVVAFEGQVTSFALLQARMHVSDPQQARRSGVTVYYYVFDVLHLDGYDLTRLPLRARKRILREAFDFDGPLRLGWHRNRDGERFYREACEKGWEGIIAKRADAVYEHRRSRAWLKFKCLRRQELVVGGYTVPRGTRTGLGALLVGYYDDGHLVYAGKVGTGFDDRMLRSLRAQLDELAQPQPAFDRGSPRERDVRYVRPELVCEVAFTEWTRDGRLRHPRFVGLRRDKDPTEVVREAR